MARILLIEDSPTDTAVLTQLLERNGHQVLSSGSAEDGIEVCKREQPDLVLMDIILPGMNGFQATRALSRDSATSAIPVLIVSTKGMETDKAWGLRQGAKDYIVKPPVEGDLIGRINELLGAYMSKSRHKPAPAAVDPFEILSGYERKSLAHIAGLPEQLDAPGLWRGVGYRIGKRRLASGFDEVVEIMPMPQVTPVPGAQPWMLGVANIRGNLLPIVDLKQFLEGERTVLHEAQRVLIVRQPGGDVAVTIDELFGQRSFNDEQAVSPAELQEQHLAEGRYAYFIDRAYRLADVSWGIFSLDRLARTPEFRQAAA